MALIYFKDVSLSSMDVIGFYNRDERLPVESSSKSEEAANSTPLSMHHNSFPYQINKNVLMYIVKRLQHDDEQDWKQIYTNKTNTLTYTLKQRQLHKVSDVFPYFKEEI